MSSSNTQQPARLCRYQGSCRYGDNCKYLHERKAANEAALSTKKTVGRPQAAINNKYKISLCAHWKNGQCNRRSDCEWAHGPMELRSEFKEAHKYKCLPCFAEDNGQCTFESKCHYIHDADWFIPVTDATLKTGGWIWNRDLSVMHIALPSNYMAVEKKNHKALIELMSDRQKLAELIVAKNQDRGLLRWRTWSEDTDESFLEGDFTHVLTLHVGDLPLFMDEGALTVIPKLKATKPVQIVKKAAVSTATAETKREAAPDTPPQPTAEPQPTSATTTTTKTTVPQQSGAPALLVSSQEQKTTTTTTTTSSTGQQQVLVELTAAATSQTPPQPTSSSMMQKQQPSIIETQQPPIVHWQQHGQQFQPTQYQQLPFFQQQPPTNKMQAPLSQQPQIIYVIQQQQPSIPMPQNFSFSDLAAYFTDLARMQQQQRTDEDV
jgi:hypothetical protein